jgi:hypothetical protein
LAQQPDDQLGELAKPLEVFGAALIYTIRPQGMRTYLDLHGQTAKVRANRERPAVPYLQPGAGMGLHRRPEPLRGHQGPQGNRP